MDVLYFRLEHVFIYVYRMFMRFTSQFKSFHDILWPDVED